MRETSDAELNAAKDSRAIRLTDPSRDPAGVFLLPNRPIDKNSPYFSATLT